MISAMQSSTVRSPALSQRHDLWVELARIEMAMEILGGDAAGRRRQLEQRRRQLDHAMRDLSR